MAVATASITTSSTVSNAEFQALNTLISQCLDSGDNTKTSDTGQGNPVTDNFPGSNNTAAFYEIRKFDDSLDGSDPIVYKIEYGRGASVAIISYWLTIGTGSDGSGNITGVLQSRTQYTVVSAANTRSFWVSCGEGRFLIFGAGVSGSGAVSFVLSLERTYDSDGDHTALGLLRAVKQAAAGSWLTQFIPRTGTQPPEESYAGSGHAYSVPANQNSGRSADNIDAVHPCYYQGIGHIPLPGRNLKSGANSNFTEGITATVKSFGHDQTMIYLITGNATNSCTPVSSRNTSNWGTLLRYD